MSEVNEPRKRSPLRVLGIALLLLLVAYVGSYIALSRAWQSELHEALGPWSEGATSYVPVRYLATQEGAGYRWHCFLAWFFTPLRTLDALFGGPIPISINQGISDKKR